MKKIIRLLAVMLVGAFATISCSTDAPFEEVTPPSAEWGFYVDLTSSSRISFEDNEYAWEGDERLGVYVASSLPTPNTYADVQLKDGKGYCAVTTKHFTTGGEGGMVCCNDDDLAWECRSVRDHGYDVRAKLNLLKMEGKQLYIHRRVGYNFRMTEIQSAIGLGELERFDKWNLPQRKKLGKALIKGLKGHPLIKYMPVDTKERENCFWLLPFVIDTSKLKCSMKEFIAAVQAEGACAYSVLWPEMYKEEAFAERKGFGTNNYPFNDPAHRKIDYKKFNCKVAASLADSTISFWTHPTYTLKHMQADIKAFKKVAAAMMK